MKKIRKIISVLATFAFIASIAGCSLSLSENEGGKEKIEYGSITIKDGNSDGDSRALDVSTITSATVTVSGYGMSDITKTNVSIAAGQGNATIENIPTGPNRVVTVESNVTGATIRAVCDVNSGENPVSVNWSTTAVGNVFYSLIKAGRDVSEIAKTAFNSAIDGTVHASLIDAATIASDYPSLKAASAYVSDYGTVSVTTSDAAGYSVQITDIASEKKSITGANDSFELKSYPGTWKAWVIDSEGTKVAEKNITVVSGETSTVDVKYSAGSNVTGKIVVHVPSSLGYNYIWAWATSGSTNYTGGNWPGKKMTLNGSNYDYTIEQTACKIIFNNNSGSTVGTNQTNDLWITEGEWNYIGGKAGTNDTTGNSVASNFEEVPSEPGITLTVNSATPHGDAVKIYVSSTSGAPTLWVHDAGGHAISDNMGEAWPGDAMSSATDLNDNTNWYVKEIPGEYISGDIIKYQLNSAGTAAVSGKTTTFWYDAAGLVGTAGAYYDSDPTTVPEPVAPTITIKPADGKTVALNGAIEIQLNEDNDDTTTATVTLSGDATGSYTINDFVNNKLSISVETLGVEAGNSIVVNASVSNSVQSDVTASATLSVGSISRDTFTWDNVNCYFVLTDRFYNGDTANDGSYGRVKTADGVASFHGGDIKGLTEKLDYLNGLGVNAIWISAPYEQMHGWTSGAGDAFAHYAFHGYYTQDWTFMDQAMGTIEEFRTFVNEAHKRGIRVVMDVVMNHTGYDNWQDMIDYGFGGFKDSYTTYNHAAFAKNGTWGKGGDGWGTDWDTQEGWFKWWAFWVRGFADKSWPKDNGVGYWSPGSGDEMTPLVGLPDVVTEKTDIVNLPTFLKTKWNGGANAVTGGTNVGELNNTTSVAYGNTTGNHYSDYQLPSVSNVDWYGKSGDWRTDGKGAQTDYQIIWLSGWVREFGVDGFRCDTAKHVGKNRWGQLKEACQSALDAWRADSSKADTAGAKDWDESFWMTGEHFDWNSIAGQGDYYTTGGFDSMINFAIGGRNSWDGGNYHSPSIDSSTWGTYLSINSNTDSDSNGNRNNVLTYISSHDTRLGRWTNQAELGTMFVLLPGGVQIYYGDESAREKSFTSCGDGDMMTRGDFNWSDGSIAGAVANRPSNDACAVHWGKVGTFRKYNPAVGAGTGTAYKRSYSGPAGESKVAIGINGQNVDVSGLWDNGTTVYNWYDGTQATVSGGSVSFSGGSNAQPILVSDKNPSDYGVTF